MRRSTVALLLCALVGGAAAQPYASATAQAQAGVAAAQPADYADGAQSHYEAAISGIRQVHQAMVSGLRTKFFMKHPYLVPSPAVPTPVVSGAPGSTLTGSTLTPTTVPANCGSVADVLTASGNFSTLLTAAQAAGLSSVLSDSSLQATVFAPTNAGFEKALKKLGVTPATLLAQPDMLQAILKYHIVPGQALTSDQLSSTEKYPTLLSADVQAAAQADPLAMWHKPSAAKKPEDGKLGITIQQVYGVHEHGSRISVDGSMSSGVVVVPDLNAGCPSVVHGIDNVLLPDLAPANATDAGMWGSLLKLWSQ